MGWIRREDDRLFLTSKIARRIFTMFVLCALLPLVTISSLSFFFVGRQLEHQAEQRLRQQCKNMGLLIYEHLISLENELKATSRAYSQGRLPDVTKIPYNPVTREGSGLSRIFLIAPDGRVTPIIGNADPLSVPKFNDKRQPVKSQTTISVQQSNQRYPALYLLQQVDPDRPAKGIIAAEINPLYLWNIGAEGALPPAINMSVMLAGTKTLISSLPEFKVDAALMAALKQKSFSGKFEDTHHRKTYINFYWSLFLKHHFASPEWVVIFSQSKASIMAPVSNFKYIFMLVLLLTFWVILLLSVRTIRNRIIPIETLKEGAKKIAQGEFGFQVAVSSGDELESLAQTFNEMSTGLKRGQAMLLQAAKMSTLGQMGAGVVHEIGQPLTAISNFADLLKMEVASEIGERYLSNIRQEMERLRTIISKFRTFTRVSEEVFDSIDINRVLDKTLNLLDHQLKVKRVNLERTTDDALPSVIGDMNGLQQVFLNLMTNAIDALEEKPRQERKLRIKTYADDRFVHIDIADTGCGIPEEIQQSIYDPFFTTKGEEKGTGLGLAIISSIIHKHNGEIKLISKPDEGACFTISLPVAQTESPAENIPEKNP